MNPEPEARRLKRAAPRRRTVAAVAVGALAMTGVAVLPTILATAATATVTGLVQTSAAGNAPLTAGTVTAYRVSGTTGDAIETATISGTGTFTFTGASALDTLNSYKFEIDSPGFQSTYYRTSSTATPYVPATGTSAYADATVITPAVTTELSGASNASPIRVAPAGTTVPTIAVTNVQAIGNDGNVTTGGPFPGQRARVTVTVTGSGGTPSGFVSLEDGGTAFDSDGTQSRVLSGGTATIDTVIDGTPGGARTINLSYSGDATFAPATGTATTTIQAGSGTITGVLTVGGTPTSGVLVEAYSTPASPAVPAVVASTTTDADGRYRLTLADTVSPDGYRLRFSKAGLVTEFDGGGSLDFAGATDLVVASNVQTADETLTATGTTAVATPAVTFNPTAPRVGQAVQVLVNAATGVTGTVQIAGSRPDQAVALDANGDATLTTVFTSSGNQTVDVVYTGSSTNSAATFSQAVSVNGGNVVSGTVTRAGAALGGVTVDFYAPGTTTGAPLATTTTSTVAGSVGTYSAALAAGDYKVRFSGTGSVTEFFNDKRTLSTSDTVTVANSAVTANADLVAQGTTATTTTVTTTPATPSVGDAYTVTVRVTRTTGTGPVPTGVVQVNGNTNLATQVPLDANGVATFTRLNTSSAPVTLTYDYLGDGVYAASSGTTTVTAGARTTTTLSATPDPVRSGGSVTLNANVFEGTTAVSAGSVTFRNGTTVIGTDTTGTGGVFSVDTTLLPVGANYVTAEFSGATGVGASISRVFQVDVLPGTGTFRAVTPKRVMQPTAVAGGTTTTLTLDAADIPAGATAVQLNVTASGITANTFISVCAGGTTADVCKLQSLINTAGDDMRNYAVVPLGGTSRNQVTFYNNQGSALVSADLLGFVVDSPATRGGVFSVYAPARVADPIPMGEGSVTTVTLDGVPAGATAVALNVTVSGVTGNTFVSACPPEVSTDDCKRQSVINSNRKDRANTVLVPLGGPQRNKVKFYNNQGRVNLILDLQGYALGNATAGADGRYAAVTPVRVLQPTSITGGEFKTITIPNVPAGATAVALNLAASGVTANTYFSACPVDLSNALCSQTSVLNSRGDDTAGFVIVKLSGAAGNEVKLYNNQGTNLILADLQGFVIGG